METPTRYRIDPRRVVHETIDGEAIVIDLETGTYFSLTGSAPEIWRLLIHGWSEDEIVATYAIDPTIAASVAELVAELRHASLIAEDAATTRQEAEPPTGTWERPLFETYTDMEYFLLLDPVHDVQATGWPHAKADDAEIAG